MARCGDPELPAVRMHLATAASPVTGRIVRSELCTRGKSASFVRHLEIDIGDTPLAGQFQVGQSFGVLPPGLDERGRTHKLRLFSIASPRWGEDGQGRVIATTVKRLIDEYHGPPGEESDHHLYAGLCSNYLCDREEGDELRLTGPAGKRFLLPVEPDRHDYLFVATGAGIAPFRGMLLELLRNPRGACGSRIELLMGSPYTTDLLYDDLLTELAAEHGNFCYHTAISREPGRDGRPAGYVDGLLEARIEHFRPLLSSERTLIYVCGIFGMQIGLYKVLQRQGLADGYVTVEPELADLDPDLWTPKQVRRGVRTTGRCMVEVY